MKSLFRRIVYSFKKQNKTQHKTKKTHHKTKQKPQQLFTETILTSKWKKKRSLYVLWQSLIYVLGRKDREIEHRTVLNVNFVKVYLLGKYVHL